MNVQLITEHSFPGWETFRAKIGTIDAAKALGLVQVFTKFMAERQDGIFRGQPPIFPITLHALVREWVSALPPGRLPEADAGARDEIWPVLCEASRELNGLRKTHPALARSSLRLLKTRRDEEVLRVLWFHHLEQQGLAWVPKLELGRSQRMFVEHWDRLHADGRIKLRSKDSTAFMSSSYSLLFSLGVWSTQGTVADVRQLFAKASLSETMLRNLLDTVAVPIDEVQKRFASAPLFPESIQNYFQRFPLIRVGEWGVFAPLPDLLLQSWDLRNLFDGLELAIENVGERGHAEYYRALGVVFEEYVHDLLREISQLSRTDFVPPFAYGAGRASPDGFLVSTGTAPLVFEAKCYRVPQASYERMELSEFERWVASLLGTNDKNRKPLEQGAAFFAQWQSGEADIVSKIGTYSPETIYIIVSYEDVPSFCSWRVFREWYAKHHVEAASHDLWRRTVVASVRDLEKLVAAGRASETFNVVDVLKSYLRYRDEAPDAHAASGLKGNLGDWILQTIVSARDAEPATTAAARKRLFDQAADLGFSSTDL